MPPPPPPALQGRNDFKSPLKELYDQNSHNGNLSYDTTRVPHATSQDDKQWMCSLVCPDILHRFTQRTVFTEQTFSAAGRNKKDAEQRAAFQALCRIASEAPELGVKPPLLPAEPYDLSGGLSRPTPSTSSASGSHTDAGLPQDDTAQGSSAAAGGSLPGTPAISLHRGGAPAASPPSPSSVPRQPATELSSRPSDAQIDAMDAAQLRRQLKAALQREAALQNQLARLRTEIDSALG